MRSQYVLSPTQAKVVRAMGEGYPVSPAEIAVYARLLPSQVVPALDALEGMGLVSADPVTDRPGARLVTLTGQGQAIARALAQYRGVPPVGAIVPLPSTAVFSGWFSPSPVGGSGTPHVLVGPDKD